MSKFLKTCYEDDEAGVFAFIWTIIAIAFILTIVIFG
jgi:hypothetical protein